jgi:hypothetical protein
LISIAASACVVAVAVAVSVVISVSVAVAVVAAVAVAVTVAIVVAVAVVVVVVVVVVVAVVVVSVVVVGDLGLKVGVSCHEMLHLFYHAVLLLGCVRHFLLLELMLHLFGAQTFDYLVDDGGSIRLVVVAEGICCYGRLATLDVALGFLEMRLERWPGFFSVFFTVPFSDVAAEKRGSGDDDETDVDELGWRFSGFGRFGHVRVFVDGCEHGGDWLGIVVCCMLSSRARLWRRLVLEINSFSHSD